MERSGSVTMDSPMSSGKHPMAAFLLSSARILYLSVRYARPMRVDYRTGDAWLDSELQVKGTPLSGGCPSALRCHVFPAFHPK